MQVNSDYALGASKSCSLHDVETDTTTTDHGTGFTGTDPCSIDCGAYTGYDGTADKGGPIERQLRVDRHSSGLVQEHLFGKAAHPADPTDRGITRSDLGLGLGS